MAKSKLEKAVEAFQSCNLDDQISAHRQNTEALKKAIDQKKEELSGQVSALEGIKETLNKS